MDPIKSEFQLIAWIRRQGPEQGAGVRTGIGDDMAVLQLGGEKLLITTDMLLEGVHFDLSTATLEQVGYKAMACSLSDCAAMASIPAAAVVSVALTDAMTMKQAQQLQVGLGRAAERYDCPLVGGDTTSWDKPLAINVSMLSRAGGSEPVLRSGARVDDVIMVTGELGGSLAGRHLEFEPRVAEALKLAELADLHAMIDISDGLSSDLDHIAAESKVAAVIEGWKVPISAAARGSSDPLGAALSDGEDFELLFCVDRADAEKLLSQWAEHSSVQLSSIGRIVSSGEDGGASPTLQGPRIFLQREADGSLESVRPSGWRHFDDEG